jgi:hypothetical protein
VPDLPWFVYLMLLAPLGLLLGAAVYKSLQVRAAKEWPSAAGKVVVSQAEVRETRVIDSDREDGYRTEQRNFANIIYEYAVAGTRLRNNRVSIGEDLGNFQVAETIAKYPVGAIVTVYYNPLHPTEAVLERDLPKGLWGCLGIATAITLAIVFGSMIGLSKMSEFISTRLVDPKLSPLVIAFGAFGAVIALFALVMQKQAGVAQKWPVVDGTIKLSGLDEYRTAPSDSGTRGTTMYERKVSYSYKFNDVAYSNEHASFSSNSKTTSPWVLRLWGMDFQDGVSVKVWVNPANPSEATLNPRSPFAWFLWLLAAGFAAAAYYTAVHG